MTLEISYSDMNIAATKLLKSVLELVQLNCTIIFPLQVK